jgi:hypothetical protein
MPVKRSLFCALATLLLAAPLAPLAATPALAASKAATPAKTLSVPSPTTGIHLEISPLPIMLTATPGTSVSSDLRVRNAGTETELLTVKLKKFSEDGPNGDVHITEPTATDEFTHWVSFDRTTFTAPPGQWQTIHMSVNVPKTAAFGYYFAVQFQRANPTKAQAGKAAIEGSVAIFVLLNADAPGAKKQMQVVSFTADHSFYEFLPSTFSVKVRNTGNVHFAPLGNIFILSGKHQLGTVIVNEAAGNVLPKSNRIFTAAWDDGFPVYRTEMRNGVPVLDSRGNLKRHLEWNFSKVPKLRIGHYTAHLVMLYNDGSRDIPIEGTLSFWVVPWRLILFIIAVPVIPALLVWWLMRWRYQKKLRKMRQHE